MLAAVRAEGLTRATDHHCAHLVLTGRIHTSNVNSQQMVRAGWEPYDAPSSVYQSWGRIMAISISPVQTLPNPWVQ